MQLGTTDAHLVCQLVDIEVAVRQVFVDHLHDALHQQFVITLDLFLLDLVFLLLHTRELTLQTERLADQVIDHHVQLIHIKRFSQISVGALFQTFQSVSNIGLRGKHDHRDMMQIDVGLNHTQESEAVHLRHHHIAHHQVVLLVRLGTQQALHGLAGPGDSGDVVIRTQLLLHELADFLVIVDNQHAIVRLCLHFGSFSPYSFSPFFYLLFRQMTVTQGQANGEDTSLNILAIGGFDGAVMHLDHHLTEIQADTRSFDMYWSRGAALIEAVEELAHITLDAHTVVNDLQHCRSSLSVSLSSCLLVSPTKHTNLYLTVVVGILEGIRQQVVHQFVHGLAVEPDVQLIQCRNVFESNTTLFSGIFVRLQQVAHILHHIRLLTVQVHLLLVDLADIQNLVHQILHALCIMLDSLQIGFHVRIQITLHQFMQRTHNQRQRRADVVGGINQEFHLLLLKFLTATTRVRPY